MSSVVYWIHLEDHTDMFSQGYIGISKNTKKRFIDHKNRPSNPHLKHAIKKYGWDKLIKTVLLVADEAYCLLMETKLRSEDKIGWNAIKGGGKPPETKWNLGKHLSDETKLKISKKKLGFKHKKETQDKINNMLITAGKATRFVKGMIPWNKGIKMNGDSTCQI